MKAGSLVSIEYSVFVEDGTCVDSNVGGEPLEYEHGNDQILPALEEVLDGLAVGESTRVTFAPENAFGPVDDEAFAEVPLETVPEDAREEGSILWMDEGEDAPPRQLRVHEVGPDSVVIDLNHPLAGRSVSFEVKVLAVRPAEG